MGTTRGRSCPSCGQLRHFQAGSLRHVHVCSSASTVCNETAVRTGAHRAGVRVVRRWSSRVSILVHLESAIASPTAALLSSQLLVPPSPTPKAEQMERKTHSQTGARVHAVQGEDANIHTLQAFLALAHHLARDEVHALLVVREFAVVSYVPGRQLLGVQSLLPRHLRSAGEVGDEKSLDGVRWGKNPTSPT